MVRHYSLAGYDFSERELRDLGVAWVTLSLAFAIFFGGGGRNLTALLGPQLLGLLSISLLTAGVAFLLHEIAHKVVAVRYGQHAAFRADYNMLFLALMSALLGFIFAAPGAVHHQGYITPREHGHIAVAGPLVNLLLAAVFLPLYAVGLLGDIGVLATLGRFGIIINLFLAAFNLVPFGPLDGRTVRQWSTPVWALAFLLSAGLTLAAVVVLGLSFRL